MTPRSTEEALSLPPRDAIAYFRDKTNVGTARWGEVWDEAHTKAFTVAGATSQALLSDFRAAVAKAIETGTTLAEFRRDFDAIVERHGWEHNGTPAWRSQIIYETNLSMAYSAGRYAQMIEPGMLEVYPYWQYQHTSSLRPRPAHLAWVGTTLRADDPWWATHYPPNGWRCRCSVRPVSAAGLRRQGKTGPDQAPPVNLEPYTIRATGREVMVPRGVDPGFGYNPGASWTGGPPPGVGAPVPPVVPPAPAAPAAEIRPPRRPRMPPAEAVKPPALEAIPLAAPREVEQFMVAPQGNIIVGEIGAELAPASAVPPGPVLLSSETMAKQVEHHPELPSAAYIEVRTLLADPAIVLRQDAGRIVVLGAAVEGRRLAAFIKTTLDGTERYLASLRHARQKDVERLLRLYVRIGGNGAPEGPPENPS